MEGTRSTTPSPPPGSSSSSTRNFTIDKENELRFEVDDGWMVLLKLTKGNAEVFGVALAMNEIYELGQGKHAVFTWYGAEVNVTERELAKTGAGATAGASSGGSSGPSTNSPLSSAYVADDSGASAMMAAVNVHARLEREREDAAASQGSARGPVVVIAGPPDAGKSTLARILCAYAARRHHRPIFVDLDVGQNEIAPPGCIAATTCDSKTITVEEGLSAAGALVYYFGHSSPGDAPDLYRRSIQHLAEAVDARTIVDKVCASSGTIINTCGWVEGEGFKLLQYSIEKFKADIVLVLGGADKLANDLKQRLGSHPTVVKMPVGGGATGRSKEYRKRSRDRRIHEYFYGPRVGGMVLSPVPLQVSFEDVFLFRAPSKDDLSDESMRPVGKESAIDPLRARPMEITQRLQYSLVAVCNAARPEDVCAKSVYGFVYVQSVDLEHKRMTLLCPQQPLPSKYLLAGSIKHVES